MFITLPYPFDDDDPLRCPICGNSRAVCDGTGGRLHRSNAAMRVPILTERDRRLVEEGRAKVAATAPLLAEQIQTTLGPNEFTTATYKRRKRR